MGCPPPVDEDERLAAIITDPTGSWPDYDEYHHAPHVLFPGMGNESQDPMYVTFHGIPDQEELEQPFTVITGLEDEEVVTIEDVAGYSEDPDTGYRFRTDLWVSDACVDDPADEACGPYVIDLSFEDTGDPPAWEKKPDFFIPVPYSPQVINYLEMHATEYDDTTANTKPGAIVFTPTMLLRAGTYTFPSAVISEGRFAYVTVQGGAIASMDTSPPNPGADPDTMGGEESLQKSAHIDLARTLHEQCRGFSSLSNQIHSL